jgi:hypothetical protein
MIEIDTHKINMVYASNRNTYQVGQCMLIIEFVSKY